MVTKILLGFSTTSLEPISPFFSLPLLYPLEVSPDFSKEDLAVSPCFITTYILLAALWPSKFQVPWAGQHDSYLHWQATRPQTGRIPQAPKYSEFLPSLSWASPAPSHPKHSCWVPSRNLGVAWLVRPAFTGCRCGHMEELKKQPGEAAGTNSSLSHGNLRMDKEGREEILSFHPYVLLEGYPFLVF